jgi:hypothetical protein
MRRNSLLRGNVHLAGWIILDRRWTPLKTYFSCKADLKDSNGSAPHEIAHWEVLRGVQILRLCCRDRPT